MKAQPLLCAAKRKRDKDQNVRVYNPPQALIIDWFLEIRHKWEPT